MEARTKYLLLGVGVIAVGTGGYFLYNKMKKDKEERASKDYKEDVVQNDAPSYSPPKTPKAPKVKPSDYPLKKGSKGELVKQLQSAIIEKFGSKTLPKYGADGYFGKELQTALSTNKYPVEIDKEQFLDIIKNSKKQTDDKKPEETKISPEAIASLIYTGCVKRDINGTLKGLWKIKNVTHYIKVNERFKKLEFGQLSMTIPTALSRIFTDETNRKKYRAQLYRIGLKWRNEKWALAGVDEMRIKSIKNARVFRTNGNFFDVPTNTLLGKFIRAKNGLTQFLTPDNMTFFVTSHSIAFES